MLLWPHGQLSQARFEDRAPTNSCDSTDNVRQRYPIHVDHLCATNNGAVPELTETISSIRRVPQKKNPPYVGLSARDVPGYLMYSIHEPRV